ncbi:hypothetical protein IJZ97_05660, partial [bacterium]|nr:hypothetical protein [bacterium]
FTPTPVTKAECETMISTHGIKECYYDSDYWAGAVKQCGHVSKVASKAHVQNIASYVYGTTVGTYYDNVGEDYDGTTITFDATKAAELGLPSPNFYLWTGDEYDGMDGYQRGFYSDGTLWYDDANRNESTPLAVCLGD